MKLKLNTLMRRSLTRVFVVAFVVAVAGAWCVQDAIIRLKTEELLESNRDQLRKALAATSDRKMLDAAHKAARLLPPTADVDAKILKVIGEKVGADELHLCDTNAIIVKTTVPVFSGYVMGSERQSRPFCRLLSELKEYAQDFGPIGYDARHYRKYVGVALERGGFLQLGFDEDRYLPIPDLRVGRILPTVMMAVMLLLVFAAVFLIVYVFFRDRIVSPIRRANESLARIASGQLDERVDAGGSTEMDALAEDINLTVDRLKGYIEEAAHRADAELAMAKSIQTNALPSLFPPYPKLVDRLDIYARMNTAKEVGGDFYDFFFAGSGRLAIVMADVSGKGVPAALFMMRAKATIQGLLKGGMAVADAVVAANDRLAESNDANMFVTAWIGVVDIATGNVEYVNAGHNPPLVKRADGTIEYLSGKSGPPLAAISGASYRPKTLKLADGDGIILYTDGVTEAVNPGARALRRGAPSGGREGPSGRPRCRGDARRGRRFRSELRQRRGADGRHHASGAQAEADRGFGSEKERGSPCVI